jgi:hypothetical protein
MSRTRRRELRAIILWPGGKDATMTFSISQAPQAASQSEIATTKSPLVPASDQQHDAFLERAVASQFPALLDLSTRIAEISLTDLPEPPIVFIVNHGTS